MSTLKPGATVWIPCEVKPGPFPDERVVLVESEKNSWIGFVDLRFLQNPIQEGKTQVLARVVSVKGDQFQATLPGHSLAASRVILEQRGRATLAPV